MKDYLRSSVNLYCLMVGRGCKPVGILPYQSRYHDEVIDIVEGYNLHYISEYLCEGWKTLYVFKHDPLRHVIKELPDNPVTPGQHALLGYLFGYETESICNYILEHCDLKKDENNTNNRIDNK